eukprot:GHVR01075776.1.p1 GENE.GHVR01075776.1~~GHVR01075776.1.p1  ORF type:complete len:259 (+),score=48.70 GHVR01075776.1:69-779(+)
MGNCASSMCCCDPPEDVRNTHTINKSLYEPSRKSNHAYRKGSVVEIIPPDTNKDWTNQMGAYYARLLRFVNAIVVLKNGNTLDCSIGLNEEHKNLIVRYQDQERYIYLSQVKDVLSTSRELREIETKKRIHDNETVAAIHLHGRGSCIPLMFVNIEDQMDFIDIMNYLRKNEWPVYAVTGFVQPGVVATHKRTHTRKPVREDSQAELDYLCSPSKKYSHPHTPSVNRFYCGEVDTS